MECTLYSDSMKRFYGLFQENIQSTADCLNRIKRGISFLADELHLGKLDIRIEAPANIYDASGLSIEYPAYAYEGGFGSDTLQFPFETTEHGHIMITLAPRPDYQWTERDKETLRVFAMNVFFLSGRARLIDLTKKAAITDNMTGMMNLAGFMQFANAAVAGGNLRRYHGFRLNIKNFKYISQQISRRTDDVLRDYGHAIEHFLDVDEAIAHLGGDNFVGLVKDDRLDDFLKFISEVPVQIGRDNKTTGIGARIGYYDIQYSDTSADVMGYLDAATSIAKMEGRDVVRFEYAMLERMLRNKAISAMFPVAVASEEFQVYYQPKVNIRSNMICGCEALVRWVQKGKIVPPMEFIPVLEEEGTICTLDFYVFERVCRTIRSWIDRGIQPVTVSVNFSKLHLRNPKLAEEILAIIEKYKVDAKYLEIELTEMSGYDNFESLSQFIADMHEKGVRTSIDDFGTGYSSLNLLTNLEADVVKLDKSFCVKIGSDDAKTKILLQNVVNMVHELDYHVLAEGVETEEQAEFLRSIGCTTVQGYLYDKPMPLDAFELRLAPGFSYTILV